MAPFKHLIRFIDDKGTEHYGDSNEAVDPKKVIGSKVAVLNGDIHKGFTASGNEAVVKEILAPLPYVPIFPCIGLNYRQHSIEANLTVPKLPVVFTKPPSAIAGPEEDVHVHPDTQEKLDYEGELTVVIGKDAKNVKAADALNYVLGYTCGNDVSARNYQMPADISGGQFGYAKSFDQFGPIGPCITSTDIIKDPHSISYTVRVNGETRQTTPTSDMIWSVPQIIEHLSRGTTLKAGTCIMTGTPSGVGLFMKPPGFLKNGDVMEVDIEKIGVLRNRVVFD